MNENTKEIAVNENAIRNLIYVIRGQQVMLDSDLAMLYQVETKVFNQAVKRNEERFPKEFCFQLTRDEYNALRSQIVTSKGKGGRRYLPYVFIEQGIAMLSAILRSEMAIQVSSFEGQIYDAFSLLTELVLKAKKEMIWFTSDLHLRPQCLLNRL